MGMIFRASLEFNSGLQCFIMLNGPTYPHLVKDFWVRAKVFDELAACEELKLLVENISSLKAKSIKEVGLKKFEEVEIVPVLMGIDVIITHKTIVKLLSTQNSRRFVVGTKENSHEIDAIKWCMFNNTKNTCSSDFRKVKNMKKKLRLMFNILIVCLIPKEGSTYQISWDHKQLHFLPKE